MHLKRHSKTWVAFVLALAIWIGLSIIVAMAASSSRRSGFVWFVTSVMISPLLAALLLFVTSDDENPEQAEGG